MDLDNLELFLQNWDQGVNCYLLWMMKKVCTRISEI